MYEIDFNAPIHVHFIGIGGISMSGLAEILLSRGFFVSGSDNLASSLTEALSEKGAQIFIRQCAANIPADTDLIVYTAAIHADNPEFKQALALSLPMLTRAQLLGQIMRNYGLPIAVSGTHGKTTTSSMASEILMAAQADPTLSIGGILKSINGNFRIGHSDVFLTEACEYTNSFLSFFPRIGIILNIDADHLDFFKDIQDIRNSFHEFAKLLPQNGLLIINGNIDHFNEITSDLSCNVVTFGDSNQFDYYPTDITFDSLGRAGYTLNTLSGTTHPITLGVVGIHNVYNSLAALALADYMNIPFETAEKALLSYTGTDRRFEYKGNLKGISIIDDYAHHPTEITATLKAAENYPHKHLWCVFQPHTYTRTKALLPEFANALSKAEHVVLADIYAARETDTLGIGSKDLANQISALGCDCHYFPSFHEIEIFLLENCMPGDLLITMGAGDVVKIGENLLGK